MAVRLCLTNSASNVAIKIRMRMPPSYGRERIRIDTPIPMRAEQHGGSETLQRRQLRRIRAKPPSASAPPSRARLPPQYLWLQITSSGCATASIDPINAQRGGNHASNSQQIAAAANAALSHTPMIGCPSSQPIDRMRPCPGGYRDA